MLKKYDGLSEIVTKSIEQIKYDSNSWVPLSSKERNLGFIRAIPEIGRVTKQLDPVPENPIGVLTGHARLLFIQRQRFKLMTFPIPTEV